MKPHFLIAVLAGVTTSALCMGDTITMKNGDHLSGTLLEISDGLVSFRTKLAGRIMTPSDQVSALNTDGFLLVALSDKTALPGQIKTRDGLILVVGPDGSTSEPIQLANVEQIQRIPESRDDSNPQQEAAKIAVTTGYKLRAGTRDASGPSLGVSMETSGEKLRSRARLESEYTEDADDADRYIKGEVEIGAADTSTFAPTLMLEVERDRNKALEMGVETAVGVTKTLSQSKLDTLESFIGIGARIGEYDPEPLRSDGADDPQGLANAIERDRDDVQLDVRLRYTRELLWQSQLTERLKVQPSISNPGELHAELESTVSVPISLNIHLNFDLLLDYESDTTYDAIDRWNTSLGAGLQIQF